MKKMTKYSTEKIAILMATYNGEKYISEQIDSLLAQTCDGWELFIHDDGSTDGTKEIIEKYADKYHERIHCMDGKSTGGARENFFYLLGAVEAPYYMTCDQDDVWLDKKIEMTYNRMKCLESGEATVEDEKTSHEVTSHEVTSREVRFYEISPCLVYTELRVVDEQLNTIAETMSEYQSLDCTKRTLPQYIIQNSVTGCTMMINRALRDKMLMITDISHTVMHDWWAALVAAQFGRTDFIEEPTILYRQHGDNSLGALNINKISYIFERVWQRKKIKESLQIGRIQAAEFVKTYDLSEDSIPAKYVKVGKMNKIKREMFYKKYGMYKTGLFRLLGQLIFG